MRSWRTRAAALAALRVWYAARGRGLVVKTHRDHCGVVHDEPCTCAPRVNVFRIQRRRK